jgi:hypothetical protein
VMQCCFWILSLNLNNYKPMKCISGYLKGSYVDILLYQKWVLQLIVSKFIFLLMFIMKVSSFILAILLSYP